MTQHSVILYGLSTCVHCKRTKEYFENHCVPFEAIYADKLEGEQRSDVLAIVRKFNSRVSFPTIVIDDGATVIVGFQEEKLSAALGVA